MRALAAAATTLLLVSAGCGAASSSGADRRSREHLSADLRKAVTLPGMRTHLVVLQRIADANGGHRAAGTPGYNASVRYVRTQLARAGLRVRTQSFPYLRFAVDVVRGQQLAPTQRDLAPRAFEYSGSGRVRGQVVAAGDGCQAGDFGGEVRGKIALIRRGSCFFAVKAANAARAGAVAAIIVNNEAGPLSATLVEPGIGIPVVGVTRDVGSNLTGATAEVEVRAHTDRTTVQNVTADSPRARRAATLMVGGHLDSVAAGAGIDDNGTGVAMLLELAEAIQRLEPRHHVRFGFWGAEESGLHGSRAYTRVAANRRAVSGYLNFDMIGAPRYQRGIYRGPFAYVFERYFAARGMRSETIDISGRSDHASFDAAGIQTGGLFSGGDPCYHQRCDRLPNVNLRGLDELADAAAHAVAMLEPR
jgi:Zn-dependent M28 family amino/carboxypeptidase